MFPDIAATIAPHVAPPSDITVNAMLMTSRVETRRPQKRRLKGEG
jgi:hypothetical protein